MNIPYVIDNQQHRLADVLNTILKGHTGKSLDIATAYFNIQGYDLLREGLERLGSFRLLLGDEPGSSSDLGIRPTAAIRLISDLNSSPYNEETLQLVESLIAFLRRNLVEIRAYRKGFLHAKCYMFYNDLPVGIADRFQPRVAIVGSSNFTGPGLTSNKELNLSHKAILTDEELLLPEPHIKGEELIFRQRLMGSVGAQAISDLDKWFGQQWKDSEDFKQALIALLDASKFGQKEYTPYQIYMKALYEYFKDDLNDEPLATTRSVVDLAEFQEDAVKKARKILARYDGVLVGDSVGLGKTWIGKKLLEDYAYHLRQKALIVCPASLRKMWDDELHSATISATILSQEELGQARLDPTPYGDADVVLIDESHNFRNRSTQRYENLENIIGWNGRRGREGSRKKIILMTATPINNNIFDLYNQITLFTGNDRSYFAGAGIGDLYRFFLAARKSSGPQTATGVSLFNLLEEVVIRRTRAFIRKCYPDATLKGKTIKWPERKLKTVRYNLEATYNGIYDSVVEAIEGLRLVPYQLETYKKAGIKRDEFEQGREEALAGIFRSRYLKRFESSIEAFCISVRRALEFTKTFESYFLDGKLLDSTAFQKTLRYLSNEDEEDDSTPTSKADDLDANEEAKKIIDSLPALDQNQYDLRHLHEALQHDVDSLTHIWNLIKNVESKGDAKLQVLKKLLSEELKGQKVIVFTYYKDTARYLFRELSGEHGQDFRMKAGNPEIRRMDSGASPSERNGLIQCFAPRSNNKPQLAGSEKEIDILISTDVLSEGQNLQDCGLLVNYDLHWNPTRMVQRAGRIDRIGSDFPILWVYNMFPEEGLERLLRLVENLSRKIGDIDRTGFLDASILGEVVHPQNFNTLRRIMEEDGKVVEEQEQFAELASNEFLVQQLRTLLQTGDKTMLDDLPDGIHSGLPHKGETGIFFYFTAPSMEVGGRRHFWRYYDLRTNRIIDNRFLITNFIACSPDTPRVVGDTNIFEIQEKVIGDILLSVQEQAAVEAAPKIVDPVQQSVMTVLRGYLSSPLVKRQDIKESMQKIAQPLTHTLVKVVRKAYDEYQTKKDIQIFLKAIQELHVYDQEIPSGSGTKQALRREDLHLVCFDFVCS